MESVNYRNGHLAMQHEGRILVCGGYHDRARCYWPASEVVVYDPRDFSWREYVATGDVPEKLIYATAQVVGGVMYVFYGIRRDLFTKLADLFVYSLDLRGQAYVWKRLEPGKDLAPTANLLTSWTFGDSGIVVLGDYDLCVYDTLDNTWTEVRCKGYCMPVTPVVIERASFAIGNKAYVVGPARTDGWRRDSSKDELYRLDMGDEAAWTWEKMVLDPTSDFPRSKIRSERSYYTLSLLGAPQQEQQGSSVLFYGGLRRLSPAGNCWMLHLDEGLSYRWTRCDHLDAGYRQSHKAVVETSTGQVWLIGGYNYLDYAKKIVKLTVTRPLSLFMLSLTAMVKEREGRLKEGIGRLPERLRCKFNAFLETEIEMP